MITWLLLLSSPAWGRGIKWLFSPKDRAVSRNRAPVSQPNQVHVPDYDNIPWALGLPEEEDI